MPGLGLVGTTVTLHTCRGGDAGSSHHGTGINMVCNEES
jgi:hypothetical protein